jgi:hypothetical protein
MSSQLVIPPLRDPPAGRLAARTAHLRAELPGAAHPLLGRRRALALAALLLALLATLLATPAFGLRDHLADLFTSDDHPPELIVRYFSRLNIAPPGTAPVESGKARIAMAVEIPGYGHEVIWVAPTTTGGFCSTNGCDRGRTKPLSTTLRISGPTSRNSQPAPGSTNVHVFIEGDTLLRRATGVEIRFEDGSSEQTPLVWVSKPIAAGFFVYELPKEHWQTGKRPVDVVALGADGRTLARDASAARWLRDAQSKGLAPARGQRRSTSTAPCLNPAGPLSSRTYSDPVGDTSTYPDITALTVTKQCDGRLGFRVTIADPFDEVRSDAPLVALDLDQNPDTGSAFYGTEVQVAPAEGLRGGLGFYRARVWDFRETKWPRGRGGSEFGPHSVGFSIRPSGLGLKRGARFNIVVASVGSHSDTAPDTGTFSYELSPGTPPRRPGPDRRAPKAFAFESTGVHGKTAELAYWALDGRGRTRQVIRIFRGRRLLKTIWTPLADANPFHLSETTWHVPAHVHGTLRFSVRSIDAAGNKSTRASAALVVR